MKRPVKDNSISSGEAAAILGISTATIRNWAKLGKLKAVSVRPLLFSAKEISTMQKELDNNALLRSRRNKTRSTENFIPKNYISSSSPNYNVIKEIITEASNRKNAQDNGSISTSAIIFCYAKELLAARNIPGRIAKELLAPLYGSVNNIGLDSSAQDSVAPAQDLLSRLPLQFIPGEDTLGMLYLSLRNLQDKKSTGAYYTPFYVVDQLISGVLSDCSGIHSQNNKQKSICDPACGTGNFLLRFPEDTPLRAIHGIDIDPLAVHIARINLALKYGIRSADELNVLMSNVSVDDFLMDNSSFSGALQYDVIIGNPPWGFVFPKDKLQEIKEQFASYTTGKSPESFALFVERAIERLAPGGTLSFLLPETILSADTHRGIRRFILEKTCLTSLSYLGEVFHKVQCPSVILTLQRAFSGQNDKDINTYAKVSVTGNNPSRNNIISVKFLRRQNESLTPTLSFVREDYPITENSFHILADADEQVILNKILSTPHFTLKNQAEFALGIVTGSNKSLLKSSNSDDSDRSGSDQNSIPLEPILKGKEIEKFHSLQARNYVRFTPDAFQQCAPERFYRAEKKLFYRFIADEPVVALDTDKTLSLNSANILIPEVSGYSPEYIMAVLNSSVISFYYRKSFKNFKVLRSYLEQLPIAECSDDEKARIEELLQQLTALYIKKAQSNADLDREIESLRKELDRRIAGLYGLQDYFDRIL